MTGGDAGSQTQRERRVDVAMAMLRLGPKLSSPTEDLVLELSPGGRSYWASRCSPVDTEERTHEQEEQTCHVEEDLVLEDIDAETEFGIRCGACRSPDSMLPMISKRSTARKLMETRSQQCIICLSEKEHTLVPWHAPTRHPAEDSQAGELSWQERHAMQRHAVAHRFCTDCWAEFFLHGLRKAGSTEALLLNCPVCRSAIEAPDVWKVLYEMPVPRPSRTSCSQLQQASDETEETTWLSASSFWAIERISARSPEVLETLETVCEEFQEMPSPLPEPKLEPRQLSPDKADHDDGCFSLFSWILQRCTPWCSKRLPRSFHAHSQRDHNIRWVIARQSWLWDSCRFG